MILPVQRIVRTRIAEAVSALYGIAPDDPALAAIVVDVPPRRALGDLAVPLAFELARRLRKAPRDHRAGDRRTLGTDGRRLPGSRRPERLHQFLPRSGAPSRRLAEPRRRRRQPPPPKRPSSSTPPSTRTRPRTSATCATPRSATPSAGCSATWDAWSRSRTTSTTPASRSPTSPSASASSKARTSPAFAPSPIRTRFDYYCWDLYARVTEWYEADKDRLTIRSAALHDIEHGGNETAAIAAAHRRPHRPRAISKRWRG